MADLKISALTAATTPLAGTEVLPIVQSSTTKKVSIADVTAGRAVSAASLALTSSPLPATSGGTGQSSAFTSGGIPYATSTTALTTGTAFQFSGSSLSITAAVPSTVIKETTSGTGHRVTTSVNSAGVAISDLFWDAGLGTRGFVWSQNSVEGLKIDSSNDVKVSAGNLVIGTSGKGIDFSATSGTGTSELLADYEEGTWTPTITAGSGAYTTVTSQAGTYTKVGRQVTLKWYFIVTDKGTGAGGVNISNLPFASNASAGNYYAGSGYDTSQGVGQTTTMTATTSIDAYKYDGTDPIVASRAQVGQITYFV